MNSQVPEAVQPQKLKKPQLQSLEARKHLKFFGFVHISSGGNSSGGKTTQVLQATAGACAGEDVGATSDVDVYEVAVQHLKSRCQHFMARKSGGGDRVAEHGHSEQKYDEDLSELIAKDTAPLCSLERINRAIERGPHKAHPHLPRRNCWALCLVQITTINTCLYRLRI